MRGLTRRVLILLLIAAIGMPACVAALESECGQERGKTPGALDEAIWKRLNDIYQDVGEENYDIAFNKLEKLNERTYGDYQTAVIAQAIAQVEWSRGNFDAALTNFELAIKLDALPDKAHFSLMYQVAQLYYMNTWFDAALEKLLIWMCKVPAENVTTHAYLLQASIYAQKEDWINVIAAVDTALSMSDDPQETWFQLKLAAHFALQQFAKSAETLETLIQYWPDRKDYWVQLSQVYYKLELQSKALSVLALAYRRDMLDKQAEIMYLSSLYSNAEIPYKAAGVLQKGINDGVVEVSKNHWAIVGDSWFAAGEMENALLAYEQAGKASDDGDLDLRRAYILVDMERWNEASIAISAALQKGGFNSRKSGEAYVLQGMSEFNLGNYDKARVAWIHASKYPDSQKSAEQWISHMREERARNS